MTRLPTFPHRALAAAFALLVATGCENAEEQAKKADEAALETAQAAWPAVARCLVGGPLPEGQKASDRMRAAELTLVARGDKDKSWPTSCNEPVKALADALGTLKSKAAIDGHAELTGAAKDLVGTSPSMMVATKEPPVDRLFDAAKAAGFAAAKGGEGPTAPPASQPLPQDQLASLGESKGFIERVERAPSETIRFMLGDADAGAFYCVLGSGEASLDRVSCSKLEGPVGVAATPLSAEDAALRFYWDAEPEPSVHEVGGDVTPLAVSQNAFVFKDRTVADVVPKRPKPDMIRLLPKGKVERAPLTAPVGGKLLGARGGAVIWRGPVRGASGRRPFTVQNLQAGRVSLSGRFERGEIPKHTKELAACRSGELLHLLTIEEPPGAADGKRKLAVARRNGKRWTKPQIAEVDLGADLPKWTEIGWRSFTCQGEVATFTWIRSDRRVGQVRCGAEGCTPALSEPLPAASKNEKLRVSGLGEGALVVRTIRAVGPLSGLTELVAMRLAPLDKLHQAEDRVLLGDDKHMGLPNLHKSLGLLSSGAAAVVLIHSGPKVYGLRVDDKGTLGKLALDEGT